MNKIYDYLQEPGDRDEQPVNERREQHARHWDADQRINDAKYFSTLR